MLGPFTFSLCVCAGFQTAKDVGNACEVSLWLTISRIFLFNFWLAFSVLPNPNQDCNLRLGEVGFSHYPLDMVFSSSGPNRVVPFGVMLLVLTFSHGALLLCHMSWTGEWWVAPGKNGTDSHVLTQSWAVFSEYIRFRLLYAFGCIPEIWNDCTSFFVCDSFSLL